MDSDGDVLRFTTAVNTIDKSIPVVTLLGSSSISLVQGSAFSDSGATWTDTAPGATYADLPVSQTGTLTTASSGSVDTALP
jgi:hypothetical protein